MSYRRVLYGVPGTVVLARGAVVFLDISYQNLTRRHQYF